MAFLSAAVKNYRFNSLKTLMARNELEAMVITGADFFQFYTNFHVDVQTWERPTLLVIPKDGEPFALMHSLSTSHYRMACERGSMWVKDVSFYAEHPTVDLPLITQLPDLLAELLHGKGIKSGKIGFDSCPDYLGALPMQLQQIMLHPCMTELRCERWVKHPEELELMRQAADISDWLQEQYRNNIRSGRLVQELDATMRVRAIEESARRFPGENLEWRIYTLSGPDSASPHGNGAQTGARITEGDGLVNIIVPRLNGVTIENERTWFCGQPNSIQIKAFETAKNANEAAIEAAVTGQPVSGIDAAARQVIENAGLGQYIRHRTGHGVGLIGHEFPEDMPFNNRPLIKNETYSAEPGLYIHDVGGFRMDDIVIVDDEPEVITKAPKDIKNQIV